MIKKNRCYDLLTYQERLQIPEVKSRFMFLLQTAQPQSLFDKYLQKSEKCSIWNRYFKPFYRRRET